MIEGNQHFKETPRPLGYALRVLFYSFVIGISLYIFLYQILHISFFYVFLTLSMLTVFLGFPPLVSGRATISSLT